MFDVRSGKVERCLVDSHQPQAAAPLLSCCIMADDQVTAGRIPIPPPPPRPKARARSWVLEWVACVAPAVLLLFSPRPQHLSPLRSVTRVRLNVSPRCPESCFSASAGTTAAITPCAEGIAAAGVSRHHPRAVHAPPPSPLPPPPSPPPSPPRVAGSDGSVAIYRMTGTESRAVQLGIANVLVPRPRLHRAGTNRRLMLPAPCHPPPSPPPLRYGLAYADAWQGGGGSDEETLFVCGSGEAAQQPAA
jgi:hypothetical protein